jgi:two-component system OmpR family response regulator
VRVLLAEDDPDIQATLAGLLRDEGFVVDTFADGQEAMTAGLHNDYHAVILDPGLPIFSGEQIVQRWKRDGRKFPIVVVTGTRNTRDQVRELIQLGISHLASKPILDYGILIDWVKNYSTAVDGVGRGAVLRHGEFEIDTRVDVATFRGRRIALSQREMTVLKELLLAAGTPLTARALAEKCFGLDQGDKEQDVRTYVGRIRDKTASQAVVNIGGGRGYALA